MLAHACIIILQGKQGVHSLSEHNFYCESIELLCIRKMSSYTHELLTQVALEFTVTTDYKSNLCHGKDLEII